MNLSQALPVVVAMESVPLISPVGVPAGNISPVQHADVLSEDDCEGW